MEALTAIGLIANIVQFVDLGAKLIGSAKEMRDSASGMTVENKSLEEVTIEMRDLTSRLDPPTTKAKSDDEKALRRLAQECRELSDQILRLLKKVAPSKPNSTLRYMRSAFKNIKYKDEMRELEDKLAKCRDQLHLQFSKLTSLEVQGQLHALATLAHTNDGMLRTMEQQMKRLRQGTCVASLSVEAQDQIKTLLGLTRLTLEGKAAHNILSSLAFDEMRTRAETIQEEHCDTFRWIVDPNAEVDDTTLASNARELYLSWLSRGRGIFHVAGKLGSGKSTLMKFLFDHPETQQQLLKWAGEAKLVVINHFFWKPGKQSLQKSFNGMMRTLLFDLLDAHPELTKIAFPGAWARMTEEDKFSEFRIPMSLQITLDALLALLNDEAVQRSYRFCFFIDALDEFEDSPQHDDRYMVDALRSWVQTSPNTIKLCVSSREHNVFVNAFADGPRIRLQELTRHDMECFTRSKLGSIPEAAIRERLTHDIVDRSDGIFLWVVLVIKQLRQALEDGRDTSSFEEELATLPTELEELFEHLLKSIPKSQRKKASQIFSMVQEHETLPIKLSLLSCLHLDTYQADQQEKFATKRLSALPSLNMQDEYELHTWYEKQVKTARTLLQGYCKGLVEDRPAPIFHNYEGETKPGEGRINTWTPSPELPKTFPNPSKPAGSRCILFVHRTVVEFLEGSTSLKTATRQTDSFDVVEAISQLHLAEFQSIPGQLIDQMYWSYLYGILIRLRFCDGKDRSQFDFLVQLEHIVSGKFPGWLESIILPAEEYVWAVRLQEFVAVIKVGSDPRSDVRNRYVNLNHPLCMSACLGNASYVLWQIERPAEFPLDGQKVPIILRCLQRNLLEDARLDDFEKTITCFTRLLDGISPHVTHFLWPRLITGCCHSTQHSDPVWSRAMGQLIALFLQRCKSKNLHTTDMTASWGMVMGEDQSREYIRVGGEDLLSVGIAMPDPLTTDYVLLHKRSGYTSLDELIKMWNFENEAEILGLIKQAYTETENDSKSPHLMDTVQEGSGEGSSDETSILNTSPMLLQRIDSAAEIRSESETTSPCLLAPTKADVGPPQAQAAEHHPGRAYGIATIITLLVLLLAFLMAHKDYWVR